MRATHESDCDFQVVGVCTCGAFNAARRSGTVPGLDEHDRNLKKLRDLQKLEHDAADLAPAERVRNEAPPAGGETGSNV